MAFSQKRMLILLTLCMAYVCIMVVIVQKYTSNNGRYSTVKKPVWRPLNIGWNSSEHYQPIRRLNDSEDSRGEDMSLTLTKYRLENYSRRNSEIDTWLNAGKLSRFMVPIPEQRYRPLNPPCKDLVNHESNPYVQKRSRILSMIYPYVNNKNYTSDTMNCNAFLHQRGYILGMTDEEAGFPVAFSILMYKDVEQVERLLRAIYRPSNYYCVHVDKKANSDVQKQMISIVNCFSNVFFSSRQIEVRWGGYSVLEPELFCMQDLLKRAGWKYFINLTGQEFPLKTNLQLVRILKILNGTNSVDADTRPKWMGRWRRAWPPPHNIQPTKGSVHVVLSRNFVDFAINNEKARDFAEWLRKTHIPDESFFSTIDNDPNLHAPGTSRDCQGKPTDYINKPFIARLKNMGPQRGERSFIWPCHGKHVNAVCVFGVADLPLITSQRELFVNKINIGFEQIFACLEEWNRNRTLDEYKGLYTFDYEFYRNMTQVKCTTA